MGWVLQAGEYRYRSRSGRTMFGIWSLWIGLMAGFPIWESVAHGGWSWLFGLWALGIGAAGWLSIALEIAVAGDGELTFRGFLWRRRWNVAYLRSIRPGNGCMVFRFASGSVMLAAVGGVDRPDIVNYLRMLNPSIDA